MVEDDDFGIRLDRALAMHGMDNAQFAAKLGPDGHQKITNWRTRGRIGRPSLPEVREILPLASMDWINDALGDPVAASADDREWKNVLGFAQAGGMGNGAEAQEYAQTYKLKFKADSLARKNLNAPDLAVIYGDGDSMLPRIKSGDAVLFDKSDTRPRDRALFVILVHGVSAEYFIKRARVLEDGVYFDTLNEEGDHRWRSPRRMDSKREPIEIIGRVRWIGSWED